MCDSNKFGSNTSDADSTSKEKRVEYTWWDESCSWWHSSFSKLCFQSAHFKFLFFNNVFFKTAKPNKPSILYLTSHPKPWALYVWDQIQIQKYANIIGDKWSNGPNKLGPN